MIKGRYPYFKKKIVEERDCFPNLKMTPSALLVLVQDVSVGHLEALGYDYLRLLDEGIVFMLSSVAVKFFKVPVLGDEITAATCPAKAVGAHMVRETVILDEEENILAEIQASWIMIAAESGRILRPKEFPVELPKLEQYDPFMEVWKLKIPEDGELREKRKIVLSDLDRNFHMNNTVYASVITDLFPDEIMENGINEIFIKYKKQAKLGNTLSLYTYKQEDTLYINAREDNDLYFQGSITLDKKSKIN